VRVSAKVIAPIAVLALSSAVALTMVVNQPAAESRGATAVAPLVQIQRAAPDAVRLTVRAQGTVEPRTESELVSEVAGRIVWVSPDLASGGLFAENDVLARIDPRDYDVALEGAQAALARAESNLALASSVLERQRSMRSRGAASRQAFDDATHAQASAEAGVREARVAVRRAELDLERSEIRAPFAGRVRTKHVDVGRYLGRGEAVARIYSIDYAEVRLPIGDADLAFLDLPSDYRERVPLPMPDDAAPGSDADAAPEPGAPTRPAVTLSADYAGERHSWIGHVVRTEGALDARTRMINVVARVDDPYDREGGGQRPPLPVGLFVDAEIEGRLVEDVFELPRAALRRDSQVWVVDENDRLHVRRVAVLRSGRKHTWIRTGLEPGDRVVTSSLEVVSEGMKVRVAKRAARRDATTSADPGGPAS
jgi:RND family efflux transporter MFP subunit